MDRPTTRTDADARGSRLDPHEAFVLPSRRPALNRCRGAIEAGGGIGIGPILLTGNAGVGKTWLWRRLRDESPPSRRWIGVDLTPANDPAEFYRLIAHELGRIEPTRVDLVDYLAELQADGERLILAIEEAHNLSMPVWEEVRVLANRLGRPGGFASMVLVGQTSLARRFSTRPFASIEARLASKVHLGPIDVDEARELLTGLRPGREWSVEEVEALHRDGAGNPGRMLRMLGPLDSPSIALLATRPGPVPLLVPPSPMASPDPLTGPGRPPIRVEENMIEVGWSPDDAPSPGEEVEEPGVPVPTASGEEAVLDHYAALQAWREWSENQARRTQPSPDLSEAGPEDDVEIDEDEANPLPQPQADRPKVWSEGEQAFAPFGQLFSKMAQAREPE
jgi:hypothetical protein